MSRVARVTADCGRGGGGFYIQDPDIPQGVTCREWRRRREDGRAQRTGWLRAPFLRPALRAATR
jgi:hypothetical protein